MQNLNNELKQRDAELSDELDLISKPGKHTESGINRCKTLLEKNQFEMRKIHGITIDAPSISSLSPIKIDEGTVNSPSENTASTNDNPMKTGSHNRNRELSVPLETTIRFREHPYPSVLINGTKFNTNEI
ncbi:unnamed protein product, partial [Adineta steineri]